MDNREKISLTLLAMILSGIVAYFSGQVSTAQSLGERPTREEVQKSIEKTQGETQRQFDDIKKQQDRTYNEIQKINDNIKELIRRDNNNRR